MSVQEAIDNATWRPNIFSFFFDYLHLHKKRGKLISAVNGTETLKFTSPKPSAAACSPLALAAADDKIYKRLFNRGESEGR